MITEEALNKAQEFILSKDAGVVKVKVKEIKELEKFYLITVTHPTNIEKEFRIIVVKPKDNLLPIYKNGALVRTNHLFFGDEVYLCYKWISLSLDTNDNILVNIALVDNTVVTIPWNELTFYQLEYF